jgi:tRNA(Glu) U13 pseudouridine synthase TruD
MGKFAYLFLKEKAEQLTEVTVAVHKAYPGKVDAIKSDLHKFHSDNGSGIHTSEHGDYVHIHLPKKGHNTADSVKRTLKDHESHPAYSSENVSES